MNALLKIAKPMPHVGGRSPEHDQTFFQRHKKKIIGGGLAVGALGAMALKNKNKKGLPSAKAPAFNNSLLDSHHAKADHHFNLWEKAHDAGNLDKAEKHLKNHQKYSDAAHKMVMDYMS